MMALAMGESVEPSGFWREQVERLADVLNKARNDREGERARADWAEAELAEVKAALETTRKDFETWRGLGPPQDGALPGAELRATDVLRTIATYPAGGGRWSLRILPTPFTTAPTWRVACADHHERTVWGEGFSPEEAVAKAARLWADWIEKEKAHPGDTPPTDPEELDYYEDMVAIWDAGDYAEVQRKAHTLRQMAVALLRQNQAPADPTPTKGGP